MSGIPNVREKLDLRRGQRRRKLLLRLAVGVLGLVVVGVLVWVVGFSSVFSLESVRVTGVQQLTEEQVTATAAAPIGEPLARVPERTVAERVAELPEVNSVTVQRKFPHSLEVRVTERQAVYAMSLGGRWVLVDAEGVPFTTLEEKPEELLGAEVPVDGPLLAGVAEVVTTMPAGMREQVTGVHAASRDAVTVTVGSREVFYGSTEHAALKGEVASKLLEATKATTVDVSAPSHPSTR